MLNMHIHIAFLFLLVILLSCVLHAAVINKVVRKEEFKMICAEEKILARGEIFKFPIISKC